MFLGRPSRALLPLLFQWTIALPITLLVLVERITRWLSPTGAGALGVWAATLVLGAAGARLAQKPLQRHWLRPLRFVVCWVLCAWAVPWILFRGWMIFLIVAGPLILADRIERFLLEPERNQWRPRNCPIWLLAPVILGAVVGIGSAVAGLFSTVGAGNPGLALVSLVGMILLWSFAGPLIAGILSRIVTRAAGGETRARVATGLVGPAGGGLLRRGYGNRKARAAGWVLAWPLCVIETTAFALYGWITTPFLRYWIFCLPVALNEGIERVFAILAGGDWYKPGFRLAVGFVGELGLHLFEQERKHWWTRAPSRFFGFLLCVLGFGWFCAFGWWAFMLVPLLRQGRHLRAAPLEAQERAYINRPLWFPLETLDQVSLGVISFLFAVMWICRDSLVTFAPDGYYHLLVARRIAEDGLVLRDSLWSYIEHGILPRWDWWEYAPAGRPHLYPPLLHFLVALFSLPFGKDVAEGMRVLQVVILPSALFSTWYLARWLFDARRGFVALLLVGMNLPFVLLAIWALPSILANVFVPFLIVFFLGRRFWPTAVFIALSLYAHMGVAPLALLGLGIFSLRKGGSREATSNSLDTSVEMGAVDRPRRIPGISGLRGWNPISFFRCREYLLFYAGAAAFGIALALPWYAHVWSYSDWLRNPMDIAAQDDLVSKLVSVVLKLRWLLMVDLILVLLVVRAWRMVPWIETRYKMLSSILIGFVPMLIEYGGRFFAHTVQLWVIIGAVPLVRFFSAPIRARRIALALLIALLCPTLMLSSLDGVGFVRMHPMPSSWMLTGAVLASGAAALGSDAASGGLSYGGAEHVGAYIKSVTTREQILHVMGDNPAADIGLAVTLGYHADRRIDSAAWPEVRPADPNISVMGQGDQADPSGCYVARKPELVPKDLEAVEVGGLYIAVRRPR